MNTEPEYNIDKLAIKANKVSSENKKFFAKLKKKKPKLLDAIVEELHEQVFAKTDCLECANCCKSISPMIQNKDIERMSKATRIKLSNFCDQFLTTDDDKDYIFKETPCPFLMTDNYCSIYDNRPKACREYPHTDRKRFYQILNITYKNTFICPAVYQITEELKKSGII